MLVLHFSDFTHFAARGHANKRTKSCTYGAKFRSVRRLYQYKPLAFAGLMIVCTFGTLCMQTAQLKRLKTGFCYRMQRDANIKPSVEEQSVHT